MPGGRSFPYLRVRAALSRYLVAFVLTGIGWLALVPAAHAVGTGTSIVLQLSPTSITADGVSTSTATATVTDVLGLPVPGDTVTFASSDPGEVISGTTDNLDGTYTATITSSTTAGIASITATDSTSGITSQSQTLTQTPGQATNISLQLSPSTITADGSSTSTATATVTDAHGNAVSGQAVSFSTTDHGETISGTADNGNGTYTATITSSTTAGQASITAAVAGISSAPQTLTQAPGRAANIALTVAPPVVAADGASLAVATATVTDAFGNAVAGGTVRFSSSNPGDRVFIQPPAGNIYTASIISSTHPGNSTITATDSTAGISQRQTLKEVAGTSSTNLVISPAPPASTNQSVALLATVSGSGGSPSGAVQFMAGGFPIPGCTSVPISPSNTLAVCQTSFAASQSPVQISAAFTPDLASTVAGSSTTGTVTIGPDATATTLGASSPATSIGANEIYTAFVSPANPGAVAPTGSVTFQSAGKPIRTCSGVPVRASAGVVTASCSATYSTLGTRRVTATYSGDQNFRGSSSSTLSVSVQPLGVITSPMEWTWGTIRARYTTIASMSANGLALGTKVIITCRGHGCPFARRVVILSGGTRCTPTAKHHCGSHSRGPVNLTGAFRRHRLMVGTRITVEIRRPGWIGKFYSFLIRSGHQPQVRISCLAPGLSKPGIGC
jgi:adhesin/invasin